MIDPQPHVWSPIADLPDDWRTTLVNRPVGYLLQAWLEQAGELRERGEYQTFLQQVKREWAIETGIIEGLYTLTEAVTLTLIEKGLDAALISHGDTNLDPADVVLRIQDHQTALEGLYQFISGERPLGTSYIKELHQVLTAHQPTYRARDTLGQLVTRELPRGEWKRLPNSVELPDDGGRFEYCPPEHVAAEMERLLQLHVEHEEQGVPPDVEAAWLHHRFSIIHPFTDGNGRVARCLATLVLLKANWLPPVVTRHNRADYIAALRGADAGDLKPVVDFFALLQRQSIRKALSLSAALESEAASLDELVTQIEQYDPSGANSTDRQDILLTTVLLLSAAVHSKCQEFKILYEERLQKSVSNLQIHVIPSADADLQVVSNWERITEEVGAEQGYYANFSAVSQQGAAGLELRTGDKISRLVFCFHGMGRYSAGIAGCTTFLESAVAGEHSSDGRLAHILSTEPFEFARGEPATEIRQRFDAWCDEMLLKGLNRWKRNGTSPVLSNQGPAHQQLS